MTMDAMTCILTRRSVPVLVEPIPSAQQLAECFEAAARAPDHRVLRPWRYVVVEPHQREALGEAFYQSVKSTDAAKAETDEARLREMPLRAPMLIIAVFSPQPHATVPEWEQWLSAGASIQNLLLALHAQGFAGMWRTGELAESRHLAARLGLESHEQIAGMIYVGTAVQAKPAPDITQPLWQTWQVPL